MQKIKRDWLCNYLKDYADINKENKIFIIVGTTFHQSIVVKELSNGSLPCSVIYKNKSVYESGKNDYIIEIFVRSEEINIQETGIVVDLDFDLDSSNFIINTVDVMAKVEKEQHNISQYIMCFNIILVTSLSYNSIVYYIKGKKVHVFKFENDFSYEYFEKYLLYLLSNSTVVVLSKNYIDYINKFIRFTTDAEYKMTII